MHFPKDRTALTTAFDGPVVDLWLERKIVQTENASAIQYRSAIQHRSGMSLDVQLNTCMFSKTSLIRLTTGSTLVGPFREVVPLGS